MSNWIRSVAIAGAAAGLLAACGGGDPPDGLDGDVINAWGAFGEAVAFVPEAEVCHQDAYQATAPRETYRPVACDQPHLVETVHVGTFTGEAAELDAPPAPDSGEHREAYAECERSAKDYLGAGFREGRLWLGVALPPAEGWDGGARWYRCELMEVASVYGDPVERDATLAGALAEDSNLELGCYTVEAEDGAVSRMNPVGCDESHEAEFVGTWRASGNGYPDPADGDAEDAVYDGCREQVAGYVDVPNDGDLIYRTGTIADWMSEQDWVAGDRAFRCYLWLPDAELTTSLADAGEDALPIQTE
jgi:putative regulator of septum formation